VPPALDEALAKGLGKDPCSRFSSAGELAAALRAARVWSESDAVADLARVIQEDFSGPELSELLGLDSLQSRDAAWRAEGNARAKPVRQLRSQGVVLSRCPSTRTHSPGMRAASRFGPEEPARMKSKPEDSSLTEVRRSITVGRPAHELYAIWRDPQNLATLLRGLVDVTASGTDRAHWTMRGQLGTTTEWDAALVLDVPSEAIAWKSVEDQGPERELVIRFTPAPANQGTEAVLVFRFDPPGGVIGEALSKLFSIAPDLMLVKVLHRFKAFAETGEVPTLQWNPSHRPESEQPGEQT